MHISSGLQEKLYMMIKVIKWESTME